MNVLEKNKKKSKKIISGENSDSSNLSIDSSSYSSIPNEVLPPKVAHSYKPPNEIKFFLWGTKEQERLIFPAHEEWEDYEEDQYEKFMQFIDDEDVEFDKPIHKKDMLRYLYGSQFNFAETLKNIQLNLQHLNEIHPIVLNKGMKELLNKGIFYMNGRDSNFRPISYSKPCCITDTDASVDDALTAIYYAAYYVIDNWLLPGKIENWILVDDLNNLAISKLPTKTIVKMLGSMQQHLKWRACKVFLVNVTFGIRALYKILTPFIDKKVKQKVEMTKNSYNPKLLELAHPSQVEKNYGGEGQNYNG